MTNSEQTSTQQSKTLESATVEESNSQATHLQASIHHICNAVHVAENTGAGIQWHFDNKPVVHGPDQGYATVKEMRSEHPITLALRDQIYQRCFIQPFEHDSTFMSAYTADKPSQKPVEDLTAELSSANQGQARWESGWVIESIATDGSYIAIREGKKKLVHAGEFVAADASSQTITVGSAISLYRPCESRHWQPGFYFAFGQTAQDEFELCEKVRFYWNIDADGAPELVAAITGEFNRFQIPFRFKCTNLRSLAHRIDTAVLYVPIANFRLSVSLCLDIQQTLQRSVRTTVPLFTHKLAPGLSFAQNPDSETSFGMERCLRLARAIVNSQAQTHPKPDIHQVIQQLKADGLDLDKPHLLPGFPDVFSEQLTEIDYEHAS